MRRAVRNTGRRSYQLLASSFLPTRRRQTAETVPTTGRPRNLSDPQPIAEKDPARPIPPTCQKVKRPGQPTTRLTPCCHWRRIATERQSASPCELDEANDTERSLPARFRPVEARQTRRGYVPTARPLPPLASTCTNATPRTQSQRRAARPGQPPPNTPCHGVCYGRCWRSGHSRD